ncbi:hypothetical protein KAR91_27150 [Candidatus Pacearchaeota archaeon]|nr:hypothetical protein [Candidatus Pacearchaeota archaeon]
MDLFTIKGTAEHGLLVRDALCARHGYQETIENPDYNSNDPESEPTMVNPETKSAFAKKKIVEYLTNEAKAYRADIFETGRAQAVEDAEAEIDGISVD